MPGLLLVLGDVACALLVCCAALSFAKCPFGLFPRPFSHLPHRFAAPARVLFPTASFSSSFRPAPGSTRARKVRSPIRNPRAPSGPRAASIPRRPWGAPVVARRYGTKMASRGPPVGRRVRRAARGWPRGGQRGRRAAASGQKKAREPQQGGRQGSHDRTGGSAGTSEERCIARRGARAHKGSRRVRSTATRRD